MANRRSDAHRHPYHYADCTPHASDFAFDEPLGFGIDKHLAIGFAVDKHFTIGIAVDKHFTIGIAVDKHLAIGFGIDIRIGDPVALS